MTPRDIIIRNLLYSDPPRIGMTFFDNDRLNDMLYLSIAPSKIWQKYVLVKDNFEFYDDEWGNIWHRVVGMGAGGEIFKPALQNWGDIKHYKMPDFDNPNRYEEIKKAFAATDRYRVGEMPGFPFSICRYLRKMEIYLQDLILEPVYILQLHDIVTSMLKGVIQCFAQAGADAIYFCEDWGIQDRLLISPEMWRQIYKPIYKELCDTAHKYNLAVLMHSCGYIWEILDDLAEVGINAFQFDQPALYGLKKLADKCRKLKVCLWSPIDIQSVLPTGNREIIEKEAEMMVQVFGRNNGGFIAKNYNDLHGIGVKPEWDQWGYMKFKQIMWHNK